MGPSICNKTERFKVGDLVVDRDGFKGRIVKSTRYAGTQWYDVRLQSGDVTRPDRDLSLDVGATERKLWRAVESANVELDGEYLDADRRERARAEHAAALKAWEEFVDASK